MSNLRDLTPINSDGPRFIDGPLTLNEPIREDAVFVDDGGLAEMHVRSDIEEEVTGRNKLFAGLAVAVLVGFGGAYAVSTMNSNAPANVVADAKPAAKVAAMTPSAPPAPAPEAMAPAAPDVVTPAPVTKQATLTSAPKMAPAPKSSSSSSTMSTAAATPAPMPAAAPALGVTPAPAPAPTQAASNVPEPVSPTPPANSVAANPALNQQSAEPVAPAPVDAVPQAAAPAPAQ